MSRSARIRDERRAAGPQGTLTKRQREILMYQCVHGLDTIETAARLGIARNTLHIHRNNVLNALGVRTIAEACYRLGLEVGRKEPS